MTIRVFGIDPSMAATGLAFPDGRTFRTIRPTAGAEDNPGRLHYIHCAVASYARHMREMGQIDMAVIEGVMPSGGSQALARLRLAQLSGVIQLALYESAVPFVEVNPISLKKYATDNGGAQKDAMVRQAKNEGAHVSNDNEADAHFLRKIGHDYYNLTPIEAQATLTKYQVELLDRIIWPRL